MNHGAVASDGRRQALTALVPVRAGQETSLEGKFRLCRNQWLVGLRSCAGLHHAHLALLPAFPGAPAEALLLLETSFDGTLAAHLDELWAGAGAALSDILRSCQGGDGLDRAALFRFVERYGVRVLAACSGHAPLSRIVIDNDARLDELAQGFLDRATSAGEDSGDVLELIERLREYLEESSEVWLGSLGLSDAPGAEPPSLSRRALSMLSCRALERRGRTRATRGPFERPLEGGLQTIALGLVPRSGRLSSVLSARLLEDLTRGADGELGLAEFSRVHSARWVALPGGSSLLSLAHDGSGRLFRELLPRSPLRALVSRAEAFEPRAQIWYSAYPDLSVRDVQRNHQVRELLSEPLDRAAASAVSALL